MHDLKSNFDKFFRLTNKYLSEYLNSYGNVKNYRHKPKMSDNEIITLSICQESLGIDSENLFWSKLKTDYRMDFPNLIHLTRFNTGKKSLGPVIKILNEAMSRELSEGETFFIVDSLPLPVCKNARENRLKACRQFFETSPDKGYSAVNKQYFIGYKLHLVTSINGVFFSMDISKASVHDVHYLNDLRYSGLNNCTLLGDTGYLSSEQKTDLFNTCNIQLKTPMRSNQKDHKAYPFIFKNWYRRLSLNFNCLKINVLGHILPSDS